MKIEKNGVHKTQVQNGVNKAKDWLNGGKNYLMHRNSIGLNYLGKTRLDIRMSLISKIDWESKFRNNPTTQISMNEQALDHNKVVETKDN